MNLRVRVLVVALTDLSKMGGTYVRVSGQIFSTLDEIDRYYIVSYGISDEMKECKKIIWTKPTIRKGKGRLSMLASSCGIISPRIASYVVGDLFVQSDLLRKVDVAHLHHLFSAAVAGRLLRNKIPIIVDIHGLSRLQLQSVQNLKVFIYEKFLKMIENKFIKNISKKCIFVVPTKSMKEYFQTEFNITSEKIFVIPDGIFIHQIPKFDKNKIQKIRESFMLNNKIVITYLGMLSPYHGFYDLVVAFNKISKKLTNVHFLFIIPKGSNSIIYKYFKGFSLTVLENIPRREIYPFLQASDVLVIPHRAGTQFEYLYSNKLVDYVASGRPIVGYSIKAIREFLSSYPLKILVEPNNPLKLAEGILLAAKYYKDEYVNGVEYLRDYDWSRIGRKLISVYNLLIEH